MLTFDRTTFETLIFVRTTNPWGLVSVQPESFAINSGGGRVTINAKQYPDATELVCAGIYFSNAKDAIHEPNENETTTTLSGSAFLKTTRVYKVDAE